VASILLVASLWTRPTHAISCRASSRLCYEETAPVELMLYSAATYRLLLLFVSC